MPAPADLEALFVAIGLDRILAGKPKLHKYELERAAALPKEIRRRLGRFLATNTFEPAVDVPDFDYDKTLDEVSARALTREQSDALLAAIPDHELAHDIGLQAEKILLWADPLMPREPKPSLSGEIQLEEPNPSSVADFRRVWNVARDPMTIIDDLEDGSLSEDQVSAMLAVYPELYRDMTQAVTDVTASMRAKLGKNWEPNPTKAALIGVLLQRDTIDPELMAAVQQVYAQEAAAAAQPAPPTSSKAKPTDPVPTPGQKALAGSPT